MLGLALMMLSFVFFGVSNVLFAWPQVVGAFGGLAPASATAVVTRILCDL